MGMSGPNQDSDLGQDDLANLESGGFTEPNIVPLVDIMLVLLVILMAGSSAVIQADQGGSSGFRVSLPVGSTTEEVDTLSNEIVISVLDDGSIVLKDTLVSLSELEKQLSQAASEDNSRLVLVQADERAVHKRVVEVMETAKRAGLGNLAIATRPDE